MLSFCTLFEVVPHLAWASMSSDPDLEVWNFFLYIFDVPLRCTGTGQATNAILVEFT